MEVQIKRLIKSSFPNLCLLDEKTFKNLNIVAGKPYKLHLGQLSMPCTVYSCEENEPSIYISQEMMNELLLDDNFTLNIWIKDTNIHLGPVVGMFVARFIFNFCSTETPTPLVVEHIKEAAPLSNCLGYCFCVDNVDLDNNKIIGYIFNKRLNKLEYRCLPIPDIIYDRAVYLEKDEKELAKQIREELNLNPNIRFINPPGSLGKWALHEKLSKYAEIKNHLPDTILYHSFDDLLSMLNKYNLVFLKSSLGSRGKQVVSIEKVDCKYRIDFYNKEQKISYDKNTSELKKFVESSIKSMKALGRKSFIVQQGIRILKYNSHNVIFRIDTVKNEYGKWITMRPYGIYSDGESYITNFCIGGIQEHFKDFYPKLQAMHSSISLPSEEEVMSFVKKMASYIEMCFGPHGEVGIDIVIDECGKLWFIEGNAKPDKSRIPGFDSMKGVAPQALAIFRYAQYLAKNIK